MLSQCDEMSAAGCVSAQAAQQRPGGALYLEQYQPELFSEFQKIAEMTSTLPSEAA